jgi:hypothetical protein
MVRNNGECAARHCSHLSRMAKQWRNNGENVPASADGGGGAGRRRGTPSRSRSSARAELGGEVEVEVERQGLDLRYGILGRSETSETSVPTTSVRNPIRTGHACGTCALPHGEAGRPAVPKRCPVRSQDARRPAAWVMASPLDLGGLGIGSAETRRRAQRGG